jgi:benzoyl-CoA reductase/2-hydroxyglutaryl-CoA dehydratase subunit BcrC/BadD/HgdB
MNLERLTAHLQDRPAKLQEMKEQGMKVVGYFPGNYVPEEIIYASGAVPVCLSAGGNLRPAEAALSVVPNIVCPFARAQIGEMMAKTNPYYTMVDAVVAPITCQHLKKVSEVWEYQGDLPVFKLGIPHQAEGDVELAYFTDRLRVLKKKLEALTGRQITDDSLSAAIDLYNKIRELFNDISLMRRNQSLPLTTLDFVKLNHASLYADPVLMAEELASVYAELRAGQRPRRADRPRLLVMGPNLAQGDYGIFDLVEKAGGEVVVEEFFEGIRNYRQEVRNDGDPVELLARSHLRERVPPAFARSSTRRRFEFALKLIEEFRVSGIVWYELLCCETYDQESYFFFTEMNKRGVPVLVVESDYSPLDTGQLRTRLGAFMELVKGGPVNG